MGKHAFVGIDPGVTGALAALTVDAEGFINPEVWDIPYAYDYAAKKLRSILDTQAFMARIRYLQKITEGDMVVGIEEQTARPRQDLRSTVKLIGEAKLLEGICHVLVGKVYLISPSIWKAHFSLGVSGGKQRDRKEISRNFAIDRFPSMTQSLERMKDAGRAEALLIAMYMLECGY